MNNGEQQDQEQTSNPFGTSQVATRPQDAMVAVEQSRAVAETQAAMVIAKRFPRNQIEAMDRVLQACSRPTLAEAALYEYSRGGTAITGPSIRMAEALAQSWGNMQFGIRELEQRNGESTVEAFAWDVETNTRQVKVFQVQHKRHTKSGSYALTDPRDIYENVANQGARRLRTCILGVIPGDVIEAAVRQCAITLKSKMDITPAFIQSVIEAFEPYGVTKDMLEKRIQRRMDTLTPALAMNLKKIINSLKDDMSKPSDWFEVQGTDDLTTMPKVAGNEGAKAALKRKAAPTGSPGEPPKQPEQPQQPSGKTPTIHDALKLVNEKRYAEATDLVKGAPFTDVDRTEIKAAIGRHQATGERV